MVARAELRSVDSTLHKKVLLAMRTFLRGEVNSLTDMALHVVLDRRAPRLPGMCRACRPIWRKARARTLKEFIGGLIEQRENLLDKIDEALQRIEEQTYGVCEACGGPIPEGWLLAVPYTTLCALCHSQTMVY